MGQFSAANVMLPPSMGGGPSVSKFGDPFFQPSTDSFPRSIKSSMDLCLYLYGMNRSWGAAINRIGTYFLTDLSITGPGTEQERDVLRDNLLKDLQLFDRLQQAVMEWAIYGNAFIRCVEPFDRYVVDTRGRTGARMYPISLYPEGLVEYQWEKLLYTVPDIAVAVERKKRGERVEISTLPKIDLPFIDKPSTDPARFSVLFIDPRFINLDKPHHSCDTHYVYTVPPDMDTRVKGNVLHEINNTPRMLLEAVAHSMDYRFHRNEIRHFKAPTPTGVSDSGWGCPEILWHYNSLLQLQVYRKADFITALDKLHAFKVFSQSGKNAGSDITITDSTVWLSHMKRMIDEHREDPTKVFAVPGAMDMQQFGGDGQPMVLHETIEAHMSQLFDGLGIPIELYRASLGADQMPTAFRLMERTYEWMFNGLNGVTGHVADCFQSACGMAKQKVELERPSMAYSVENMQLRMQLAANRELPRTALYRDLGAGNPVEAAVAAAKEDQDIKRQLADLAVKFEREQQQGSMADIAMMAADQGMQQAGGGQAAAGGGAPLDYAVNPSEDPSMLQQRGQEIAQQWLTMHGQQPNSHRQEMARCEATNPTLFATAKRAMEKQRQAGASQGRAGVAQSLAQGPQQ